MVIRARQLNPGIEFQCGDMLALDLADNAFAGMTSFYSVVNLPRDKVTDAFRQLHRVLETKWFAPPRLPSRRRNAAPR